MRCAQSLTHVQLFVTPWTVSLHQAPLSMEFSRQEYWSGLPFPPPGNLPNPGMELTSPVSPALAGRFFTIEPSGKPQASEVNKLYPFLKCVSRSVMSNSFATPWTVACQVPLSMGFSRQEYWRGLPFPPPGDLPDPGIELTSPVSPALAKRFFTTEPPGKPSLIYTKIQNSY